MRYHKIRKMDVANGPGLRVSIFFQGCTFHCKNCFNPETHDFHGGLEFTNDTINHILNLCEQEYIAGLSILGGEPMHPKNIQGTTELVKAFQKRFPEKTIWVWTGFLLDRDLMNQEVINYIDVLVDGQYVDELHDPTLKWKGSKNQRVIDVKKTLKCKQIILYEEKEGITI